MKYVFDVSFIKQTEKAIQVRIEDELLWLPKSQIEGRKKGSRHVVILPYWLADKNGLFAVAHNGMNLFQFTAYTEDEIRENFY